MSSNRFHLWALYLSEFNNELIYTRGFDNRTADVFSRLPFNVDED